MAISRAKAALAAAALLAGMGAIARAQDQQSPESLLPPGFGEPVTPAPAPSSTTEPGNTILAPEPVPSPSASPTPVDPATLARYEMPAFARRSLARIGAAGTIEGGVAADAFGAADGGYLEALMRRLSAPLPSRWLSIALRRTLVSRVDTPAGVNGADFAAERAWLLLRMGESVAARGVIQGVDTDDLTPKARQVAMQAALATADPAGLCPLTQAALARTPEPGWILSQAMCATLAGVPGGSQPLFTQVRRKRVASGIDLQLAQKVAGAGANSRQAISVDWAPVAQLTTWRFGLATATGVTIPDPLYATVGPQVSGWRALAPAIPPADRAAPAAAAATLGVLSNVALVDLYAALEAAEEAPPALAAVAADLRTAYVGGDVAARRAALRQLWEGGTTPGAHYARLILTARAAARIPAAADVEDADTLVAAMLSAGLDRHAALWRDAVPAGGDAWAMIALADPDTTAPLRYAAVTGYAGRGNAALKQRMLFAGLAGLGRLSATDIETGAAALEVPIGVENAWTRALDRAVRERQPGSVVLLAAIGMQADRWRGVPPAALYRIVGALRAVGLGGEARMIAAEAIARL